MVQGAAWSSGHELEPRYGRHRPEQMLLFHLFRKQCPIYFHLFGIKGAYVFFKIFSTINKCVPIVSISKTNRGSRQM